MSAVPKNLRAFAGMLESINEAITVLDKVESMEQLENEHRARVERLQAEANAAAGTAVIAKDTLAAAQREAIATIEQAKVDAETIRAKADADARQIRETALDVAKAAKAKENASEAAERKAWESIKAFRAELETLAPLVVEAQATIAKAEAIKRAMG